MKEAGLDASHMEGDNKGGWILLDLNDVVVHILQKMNVHTITSKNSGMKHQWWMCQLIWHKKLNSVGDNWVLLLKLKI